MSGARGRMILAAVVAVVVCAAFYMLFIRAKQADLTEVRGKVETEENRTQQLETELARLEDLQENAPELEARLQEIRKLVPVQNEVPNFIFQVQDAASRAGVDFVQIAPELPKPPPEGAQVAQSRVVIGAEGGYFALQDLLRRLYSLDRAVRVDNLALNVSEDNVTGTLSVTLDMTARIFFELPEGTAAATTETAAPADTEPAPAS